MSSVLYVVRSHEHAVSSKWSTRLLPAPCTCHVPSPRHVLLMPYQVGQLASTLGWGLVVEAIGLRASFGAAALLFSAASLPLLPHLPRCARGCARGCARVPRGAAAHVALARRGAARRRETQATGLVGPQGLPAADLEAWTGELALADAVPAASGSRVERGEGVACAGAGLAGTADA